jgi:hypothetical protein
MFTFTEVGTESGPASSREGGTLNSIRRSMHSRLTSVATSSVTSQIFSSEPSLLPRKEESKLIRLPCMFVLHFNKVI